MTPLRQALADYLAMRRALGYRLVRAETLLSQFLAYVEARGDMHLRSETALAWATEPTGDHPSGWASQRLSLVRGFATHLHTLDPRRRFRRPTCWRGEPAGPRRISTPTKTSRP